MDIPSGSVDTHAHVFVPGLAMASQRRYTPSYGATLDNYLSRLDAFGLTYGVLIQPSFLGVDNRFLVQALQLSAGRCKGVAVVDTGFTAEQLASLKRAGIEGIRLNLFGSAIPPLGKPEWQALLTEVNHLKWHVEVHCPWDQLREVLPPLHAAGCRVVVDHFGRPDFSSGCKLEQLDYLCGLGSMSQTWVKLSAAYRIWSRPDQRAYDAALDRLLSSVGPTRLMWGSDWPHTQHETTTTLSEALLLLTRSSCAADLLDQILVRTPQSFYDF